MKPTIVITGASQGIGAAIAREFAREVRGVRLALIARNARNLARVAAACAKLGAKARTFVCDVTDPAAVAAAAAAVDRALGTAEVLVNNAGAFAPRPFLEETVEGFDAMVAANLRSAFLISRAFVPAMARRGCGHVFMMSSIAGLDPYPQATAYCAAKFGVTGLGAVMRRELRAQGVRVTTLYPGATWTPSWEKSGVKPERLMPARSIARAVVEAWRLGPDAVVEDIVLRPPLGDV
ncbi:MAG: SDR family oxidoreductase [Opitutaceae bacterium]|nr:SDR family oxidoreductase [Opitutaceae bacterium]